MDQKQYDLACKGLASNPKKHCVIGGRTVTSRQALDEICRLEGFEPNKKDIPIEAEPRMGVATEPTKPGIPDPVDLMIMPYSALKGLALELGVQPSSWKRPDVIAAIEAARG